MHAENTGVPTDGYSLDGSPNLQTHKDVGSWFLIGGMGNNCL